jgi:hypothetical protein
VVIGRMAWRRLARSAPRGSRVIVFHLKTFGEVLPLAFI